jgi:hypothetical protein
MSRSAEAAFATSLGLQLDADSLVQLVHTGIDAK